jgi:integrase-like protein
MPPAWDLKRNLLNLAAARETIEAWRYDYNYNHMRPHGSLGTLTPTEFAVLKGQEMQTAPGGRKTRRTLLMIGWKLGSKPPRRPPSDRSRYNCVE